MDKIFSNFLGMGAAAIIALLSGLGVGSGGLLVIWLTMIEGMDAGRARGLNLMFFVFSASAALIIHLIKKRVKIRFTLCLAAFAAVGTLLGTYFGSRIDPLWLRRIFGGMFILTGFYTLYGSFFGSSERKKSRISSKKTSKFSKSPLQNKNDVI